MQKYNDPKARAMKVREAVDIVEPQIERVSESMMRMVDLITYSDQSKSVNTTLLEYQDLIAEMQEAIENARREMAIYLVVERGISREKVAKTSRVTGMTVGRWVKALEEK